jgi:hypothetical protein
MTQRRGFALLAVVWVIALLAVMGLDVLAAARRDKLTAIEGGTIARMRAVTDAGLFLAIRRLHRTDQIPGSDNYLIVIDDTIVRVSIEIEHSKIDLNRASIETIKRGLLSIISDQDTIDRMIISLRRDRDILVNRGIGRPYQEFRSVDEFYSIYIASTYVKRRDFIANFTVHGNAAMPTAAAGRIVTASSLATNTTYRINIAAHPPGRTAWVTEAVVRVTPGASVSWMIQEVSAVRPVPAD